MRDLLGRFTRVLTWGEDSYTHQPLTRDDVHAQVFGLIFLVLWLGLLVTFVAGACHRVSPSYSRSFDYDASMPRSNTPTDACDGAKPLLSLTAPHRVVVWSRLLLPWSVRCRRRILRRCSRCTKRASY